MLLDLIDGLDSSRFEPILWCNGSELASVARSKAIRVYESPMQYWRLRNDVGNLRRFYSQIHRAHDLISMHGIQLLHANSAAPAQWLVPIARSLRIPLVVHLHSPYLRRDRFALLLHHASVVVGVSQATLAGFVADGMPSSRLRLIPNGIDAARYSVPRASNMRNGLGIGDSEVVIGTVGSLIPRKAIDLLLRAFASANASRPMWLLVAGEGPERAYLTALAEDLGVSTRTIFLGYVCDPIQIYDAIDVHVLASRQEAFGLVIAEAAFRGVPTIGSNIDGISEVIRDNETGVLFTCDDPIALGQAIRVLVDDDALRHRLGSAARLDALNRFTLNRVVVDFQGVYEELLLMPPEELGWASSVRISISIYARLAARLSRIVPTSF